MMGAISAAQLLEVWERGFSLDPARRALSILAAAHPKESLESLAELPIGQRDMRLLGLRTNTFGARLNATVNCERCAETLELDFSAAQLEVSSPEERETPLSLESKGYKVEFRLPNTLDLISIASETESEAARRKLLRRCTLTLSKQGEQCPIDEIPQQMITELGEAMLAEDPHAEIRIDYECPSCGEAGRTGLDVLDYFWQEIDSWARRMLVEIHRLAYTYGWSETDIVKMSPLRRQFYLSLVDV